MAFQDQGPCDLRYLPQFTNQLKYSIQRSISENNKNATHIMVLIQKKTGFYF